MTLSTPTVRNTPYTVTDADGMPLCHAPAQNKASLNSARKRAVRESFEAMVRAAGMVTANGRWTCAVTGRTGYRNTSDRSTAVLAGERTDIGMLDLVDAGHVVPDADGGAMCPCNLVPQVREDNLAAEADKNAHLTPATFKATDPRVMWATVWAASARPGKLARARAAGWPV